MPKVLNRHDLKHDPPNSVYIGRPSKFGNPYTHLVVVGQRPGMILVKSRAAAVEMYRKHLEANPRLVKAAKKELRGKNLVCWCAPLQCHGDILLEIANE